MTFDEIKAIALDDKISTRSLAVTTHWSLELNTLIETLNPLTGKKNPDELVGCAIYQTSTDSFLSNLPSEEIKCSVQNPFIYFYLHKTIVSPIEMYYSVSCYKSIFKMDNNSMLVSVINKADKTPELIDFFRRQFNDF